MKNLIQEWTADKTVSKLHFLTENGESFLCEVSDTAGSPVGWVAVDSLVNGKSHGGLRISQSLTAQDLRTLAHRMTLKFGFLGLAGGGSKAGIIGDPEAPQDSRIERLRLFADAIAPLISSGSYIPHPDVGTSGEEIGRLLAHLGIKRGPREPTREQSGTFTSLTVVAAARVGLEHIGMKVAGARAAIEGFGKVGFATAQCLSEMGAKVVSVSTSHGALHRADGLPVEALVSLQRIHGSRFVQHYHDAELLSREKLLELPVDLLCPCGVGRSIDDDNALRIQARVISAGANYPVTEEAEDILSKQGILCLPDFITNSGGVLGGTTAFAGIDLGTTRKLIEDQLVPRIKALIAGAKKEGKRMSLLAEQESMERFRRLKIQAEEQNFKNTLFNIGLEFFRRGWLPPVLLRGKALQYFSHRLQ